MNLGCREFCIHSNMEMTEKNIDALWEHWIGSEMLIPTGSKKSLERPKNFLGSVEQHKKQFMKSARIFLGCPEAGIQ